MNGSTSRFLNRSRSSDWPDPMQRSLRLESPGRRRLLVGGAAAAAAAGLSPLLRLGQALPSAAPGDYKALVCVFLAGGNDSHNLLVPRSGVDYAKYAAHRSNLAVPAGSLLPIEPVTSDGREYGLHPSLTRLQGQFEAGRLALVRNVGPLVEPVTKASWTAGASALPPQLFSHKDQQHYWQTAVADPGERTGWAGRIADRVLDCNGAQPLLTNLSIAGSNTLQVGETSAIYAMGPDGPSALTGFGGEHGPKRRLGFDLAVEFAKTGKGSVDPFAADYARTMAESIELEGVIRSALDGVPALAAEFPASPLGQQLRMIAEMIAARGPLGVQRQLFFAQKDAFDNHSNLIDEYPILLADLDASLAAFQGAMEELGLADSVVLFTASDFGRSLSSNGQGSDHGWGGHAMVLGGPVAGQELYGTMPELELDGPDDVGAGRLIPTTSVDAYGATLASWFGIPAAELDSVFPNLGNFAEPNLGFLSGV